MSLVRSDELVTISEEDLFIGGGLSVEVEEVVGVNFFEACEGLEGTLADDALDTVVVVG
jgi:hypothetical protein